MVATAKQSKQTGSVLTAFKLRAFTNWRLTKHESCQVAISRGDPITGAYVCAYVALHAGPEGRASDRVNRGELHLRSGFPFPPAHFHEVTTNAGREDAPSGTCSLQGKFF